MGSNHEGSERDRSPAERVVASLLPFYAAAPDLARFLRHENARLLISVAVVDCHKSVATTVKSGEREMAAVFAELNTKAEKLASANGGVVMSNPGDGVVSLFRNNVDAVNFALDLHGCYPRRLRIGVHSGAVEFDRTGKVLYALTIAQATRLEQRARPGHTLVSHAVREEVDQFFGSARRPRWTTKRMSLKGLPGEHRVHCLSDDAATRWRRAEKVVPAQ